MSEQLTPERLAELRRIAEAAKRREPGAWTRLTDGDLPGTLLAMLDEIERLRQERDTLDSGLDGLEQAIQYRDWPAVVAFLRAARKLLDAKNGGGDDE